MALAERDYSITSVTLSLLNVMSWPAPYFVADATPSTRLELIASSPSVTLSGKRGELKDGTLLIGKGTVWYRKADRSLLRLVVPWPRNPELHASIIRLNPRIDLFLESYSTEPEFVLYFPDQRAAQQAHTWMLESAKHPMPPPPYASVEKPAAQTSAPAMIGVARIIETEKKKIQEEQKLTSEAFSDLNELMSKASEVMELVKKCATSLSASHKDMDSFDKLLAEIGVVDNPVTKETAGKKYHQELSKQIAEFLSQRKPPSVVVTVPDVYALYNRARGGAGLVSPSDVLAACQMMAEVSPDWQYVEYPNGLKAVRNRKFYSQIEAACRSLLEGPSRSVSAADLTKTVSNLPLAVAKEWLVEKENHTELVRDRDQYGNIRWFPNLFFK